ncbi:O-antigen ligase domain-containing protein, partial [Pseudoxanthomonas sp. SGD-10]
IIGFFIRQKKFPNWGIFRNSISYIILIWVSYNILQIFNPIAESRLVWVYTIRSVAAVMLMYFIFVYHIRSVEFIRLLLKIWIALSLIGALYAFWQEFVGFLPFEEKFLNSDPKYRNLLFIAGKWRKFSIYSDPVAFSYNMVISSILCIVLMFNRIKLWKKIVLGIITALMLWAMIFSGTRGAYVLLPAALALLALLKMTNIKVLSFAVVSAIFLAFLIYVPTSSYNIRRFQSAFKPSQDASFNVRALNQKRIQPYIQEHPFGAGLGAVSGTGKAMMKHSVLTGFAPDSGYVRVAVELGWVGLLLFCTLFFIVIKSGINSYFKIEDPELKNYCLAMTLIAFVLAIGSYPQEAIVQFPTSIYFYLVIAIITITRQLHDKNYPKAKAPVKHLI